MGVDASTNVLRSWSTILFGMDTSYTGQLHGIIPSEHHITTAMDQPWGLTIQEFWLPAVCWMKSFNPTQEISFMWDDQERDWKQNKWNHRENGSFLGQTWCTTPYSVPIGPGDHPVSRPLSWWRTGIPHDLRNPIHDMASLCLCTIVKIPSPGSKIHLFLEKIFNFGYEGSRHNNLQ